MTSPPVSPPLEWSSMPDRDDIVVPVSAIEHYEYCARQCALIHVDGVWSDNQHTVRGTHGHRRVDSGAHRHERGSLVLRAIPLWSEIHGLSGRADAVEVKDGAVWPVEYKAGTRHGRAADLQVCAQALCLEEMLGLEVPYGYVWYAAPRRRSRVEFTTTLRAEVLAVVESIREQLRSGKLPAAPNDTRCTECQLLHHCLPEISDGQDRVTGFLQREIFGCAT